MYELKRQDDVILFMTLFVMGSIQIPIHSLVVFVNFRSTLLKFIIYKRRILNEITHSLNECIVNSARSRCFKLKCMIVVAMQMNLCDTIVFAFVKV